MTTGHSLPPKYNVKQCDNCSGICDKAINHDGRWFYDCHTFTGSLKQYNDISIVRDENGEWRVRTGTANDYIEMPIRPSSAIGENDFFGAFDYQLTSPSSVCIDPDASAWDNNSPYEPWHDEALVAGSLECLDGPDWVFLLNFFNRSL